MLLPNRLGTTETLEEVPKRESVVTVRLLSITEHVHKRGQLPSFHFSRGCRCRCWSDDLSRSPRHDVDVADGVEHQQHAGAGHGQEVEDAVQQARELERVHDGRHDKHDDDEDHENGGRGADPVILHLEG